MNSISTENQKNAAESLSAPQMVERLGKTTYDVYFHFSPTSKETMTDKVMRLIRNDMNSVNIS